MWTALALNPVKLHELLVRFGWITWAWEKCTEISLLTMTFLCGEIPHPGTDPCLWIQRAVSGCMDWQVVALMLCFLLLHSHADIPESSICYNGALLESVIRTGQKVWLVPQQGCGFLKEGLCGEGLREVILVLWP